MPENGDDFFRAGCVASQSTTESLTKGAVDDIDLVMEFVIFFRSPAHGHTYINDACQQCGKVLTSLTFPYLLGNQMHGIRLEISLLRT